MADGALGVQVMEVLWEYSDEQHPLSQRRIRELLLREHGVAVKPKVLHRVLNDLVSCRSDVRFRETTRVCNGQECRLRTDFYLQHPFRESELQQMLNCVRANRALSPAHQKDLAARVVGLGSRYFRVRQSADAESGSIWVLEQTVRRQMNTAGGYPAAAAAGALAVRRVLRPVAVSQPDEAPSVTACCERSGAVQQDLGTQQSIYTDEPPGVPAKEPVSPLHTARFCIQRTAIPYVRRQFGDNVSFGSGTDEWLIARIRAPRQTLIRFAQLYGDLVVLLQPADMRRDVQQSLHAALSQYIGSFCGPADRIS